LPDSIDCFHINFLTLAETPTAMQSVLEFQLALHEWKSMLIVS
jgi:hypothetical protein